MFLTTEIAQILPGGLIRPTLQSEKKTFGGQKKKAHSLFSGPNTGYKTGSKLVKILRLEYFSVPEYSYESEKVFGSN